MSTYWKKPVEKDGIKKLNDTRTPSPQDDDFTIVNINDTLILSQCSTFLKGEIDSTERLNWAIKLLSEVRKIENAKNYEQQLQTKIISSIENYVNDRIQGPYLANYKTLAKEDLTISELENLDAICDAHLEVCKHFDELYEIINKNLDQFTPQNQQSLQEMMELAKTFSSVETKEEPLTEGFNFCKKEIAARIELSKKLTALVHECKEAQKLVDTSNCPELNAAQNNIEKKRQEVEELVNVVEPPNQKEILAYVKREVPDMQHSIKLEAAKTRVIGRFRPEFVIDKRLEVIRNELKTKDSFKELLAYAKKASAEKKSCFSDFETLFKEASTLDELKTLIFENYKSASRSNKSQECSDINKRMIENTGCGFCGCFGFFYKSTTHKHLLAVANDLTAILDNNFPKYDFKG